MTALHCEAFKVFVRAYCSWKWFVGTV